MKQQPIVKDVTFPQAALTLQRSLQGEGNVFLASKLFILQLKKS